jgi:hypothetical protein
MIQNYGNFSKWNIKSRKICTFLKFMFIQQWPTQNMWHIGATICTFNHKLQKISYKKISYEKWKGLRN